MKKDDPWLSVKEIAGRPAQQPIGLSVNVSFYPGNIILSSEAIPLKKPKIRICNIYDKRDDARILYRQSTFTAMIIVLESVVNTVYAEAFPQRRQPFPLRKSNNARFPFLWFRIRHFAFTHPLLPVLRWA
jgi:hypothetical protein